MEKAIDEQDRRARVLRLTATGKAKVDAFMPIHIAALNAMFADLSNEEMRQTISTLNRLRKTLPNPRKE